MLKPGSISDFQNSMAKAMEDAFQAEWSAVKDIELGDAGEEDRKILFAAIAQGVVKHLQEKINTALKLEITVTQNSSNITSSGSSVTVTQQSGGSNRVVSAGTATHVELLSE